MLQDIHPMSLFLFGKLSLPIGVLVICRGSHII